MRRSISYCEPNIASAGEINTWKFVFTPSADLQKGAKLKFDLGSKGRSIDWEMPSVNLNKAKNVIFGQMGSHKAIPAREVKKADEIVPNYEFVLPAKLAAGSPFTIIIGSLKAPKQNGTQAQTYAQRRRTFELYVDPSGKGKYDEAEAFNMDVKGNTLQSIRILVPSFIARNKRFDAIVRFEDEFGNLTSRAPEDTLIELSHEHLRENLKWNLFIPETGFITLPNLYFNEPGVYTIKLKNTKTKEEFFSGPVMCFAENPKHLFWGYLRGESERIDSTENIDSCLRHFRDDKAANFYASSPFESVEETSNETWKQVTQNITEFDEAERFTTFIGFQWKGKAKEEGVRQFIYTKDHKQILRQKDAKYSTLSKIYKSFNPKDLISIPTFTMAKGYEYDFKHFNPDFERVVEIYNAWGSSECTNKEGNEMPISSEKKGGIAETGEGSIQKALAENCRFGFVAGGLDDRGFYANFFESTQMQYPPGITAIIAAEHTRSALAEALYNRSCYATTGERMIVGFNVSGVPMGGETTTALKPGLKVNRHISGYVAGSAKVHSVEIVRNGKVIKTFDSDTYWLNFTYDDMTPIEKVVINAKDKKPPFVYYYIRFIQEDGHTAWSSPIWVDYIANAPTRGLVKRAPPKITKKPIIAIEDIEDGEEIEDEEDFDDEDDE
jgi:hypothetical protein